ncbi:alpha/beta hydrolase family protein [Solilutibacter pythonis]|nr:prolyl oligopeptidase family serine peptidase [Lysobacter pythonis]
MRLRAIAGLPLALLLGWPPSAAAQTAYREPPAALKAIADAPRAPRVSLSPRRDLMALMAIPGLPGIEVVAQPEEKLAGIRIHPRVLARSSFSFGNDLWLQDVATGREIRIEGLPRPLSIAGMGWSPDQKYLAFNQVEPKTGTNALWLVDVAARRARLLTRGLNTISGRPFEWMPGGRALLVTLRPADVGAMPVDDSVPAGPNVQRTDGDGRVTSVRTYQDLLKNEADARRFEYLLRAQAALVGVDGRVSPMAAPALYTGLSVSPDGRHILSQRIVRPFSYLVPMHFFPRTIEVRDLAGKVIHTVAKLPLVEGLPTGNDAVPTGVRRIAWRGDAPATLVWAEARDGGDPAREVAVRDVVYMQPAPFTARPVELAKLSMRYSGTQWGRGDLALLGEYWWKTRRFKTWRIRPDAPGRAPALFEEGSSEDRYADKGEPVLAPDARGQSRLLTSPDGGAIYRIGDGASPEGDRPFLDRQSLADGETTRLFHSSGQRYERPVAMLDAEGKRLITSRESPSERPNFWLRELAADDAGRALTRFPHPTPQLREVRKELIRYRRADGVELTANLYLPPGYDPKRDGRLPLLMWAYPGEFKSAAAASQVTGSPYRFNNIGYWGPLPYLATGYAVLDNPGMPIIGEGQAEPNDSYIEQLRANAQAAVDEVVRRGVADPARIAVGGHSYGAFMTANLLAHTRLFRAGIARSGAYNRTLTPFGFQAEERNFWRAPETYAAMSPFNHADKIKDALLLIHGEEDNNSGTFPMQSARMYQAVRGLGGHAKLVMLPKESHGYRARESILTMMAETHDWLEQNVKRAVPRDDAR